MKHCSKCGEEKPLEAFHRDGKRKDGVSPQCKACVKAKSADWYQRNKERVSENATRWRGNNREKERARCRRNYAENLSLRREANRRWFKDNPDKSAAKTAKRRFALLQRCVLLTPAKERQIAAIYAEAKRLTEETGVPHHVDHIVPLRGKTSSGLHVPENLRVIPAQLNLCKGAKIDYELVQQIMNERIAAHA